MKKVIIAVDPGASGGIAVRYPDGEIVVEAMPATEADAVMSIKTAQKYSGIEGHSIVAYVEKVGGYVKGKGAPGSSMFNFGRGVGVIHGALIALEIPTVEVTPQAWQKALGTGQSKTYGKKWKDHLKGIAQRMFPALKPTLKTADALLILEHARRKEWMG